MKLSKVSATTWLILVVTSLICPFSFAHNGKIAYARPLGKITVNGDLTDWPETAVKYSLSTFLFGAKPTGEMDFSAVFQLGYRVEERSLYLAITVTDDSFVEDTSANARFNSQDCLELCLDARHLPFGSGVASFMYSKKLRNTNHAVFDPFARNANWEMMEVAVRQNGNKRYYEWHINLGDQFVIGKSLGLDLNVFDKDPDGSFSATAWGKGDGKIRIPGSLGDIVLIPAGHKMSLVVGQVAWDRNLNAKLPGSVRLTSLQNSALWFSAELDSSGNFAIEIPVGKYELILPDAYIRSGKDIFSAHQIKPLTIIAKAGETVKIEKLVISGEALPDLIPEKGILHDFTPVMAMKVDTFIESYRRYYDIPGVSLALIKDGKVVYHKTYGVKNSITAVPVTDNTLFEAASITKPVFSFAVQRLAEKGVIDLDKSLYLYLPYADIAYDERYKLITARHVLTHRTGFPNWRWMNDDQKLNIRFIPGTDYNYSGEGFEYLKLVVEKVTGKKVEQILKEEVLDPTGLYHTFFSSNDSLRQMVANGHFNKLPTYDEPPATPGMAYSMHTEAKAFTKFMLFMLEQRGLNWKYYDTMFTRQSDYKYNTDDVKPKNSAYMGMSLEIRETPYGKTFGHGGNNGDFTCHFEVYKDIKAGYVIFTNSNTSYPLLSRLRNFLIEGRE